jgi:putative salt-induced outer membrane protein
MSQGSSISSSFRGARRSAVLAFALFATLQAGSAAAAWTGKGEAGASDSSGNTDSTSANVKIELIDTLGSWKHLFGLAGNYAADTTGATAQRWEAREQSDYSFNPRMFWFGGGRYEDDRFSGFDYQGSLTTGLGYHFIATDATKLTGQVGVGYKLAETRDVVDANGVVLIAGDNEDSVIFTGAVDYEHQITDTTKVIDRFLVESGSDNTYLQNELSLQVRMTDVLALAVGYAVRHNTDPPEGFEETDTLTTLNLVYELK